MQDLVNKESWMSKKELAEFCKCSLRVLEQIVAELTCETGFATQTHIKKGGYHNSEIFYDDYLVKLIQAKLMKNQANQGRTSQVVKQTTMNNLQAGVSFQVIIDSGNEEAFDEYMGRMRELFNAKRNLKLEQQQNKQLAEENNYLKKLTDFQSTQIDYYTKKYHSWYDNYENY